MAWALAAAVGLWALMRTFGLESGYPLVPLIAYTPYVAIAAVLVVAGCGLLRQWIPMAVAGLAAVALGVAIAPRLFGGDYQNSEGRSLSVMTANVLAGGGDAGQLAEIVRDRGVEVLAVQELTPEFAESFERTGVRKQLPHAALALQPGVIGSGIYSRYPLQKLSSGPLEFLQMRARIRLGRRTLEVTSVHPKPPTSSAAVEEWEAALGEFRASAQGQDAGSVELLLGDFNATLDHSEFRAVLDRGFVDAGEDAGGGLAATWPAIGKSSRYLPVTIDHLVAESDELLGVRDYEVLELDGSDHRPVVAELVLRLAGT